MSTSSAAASAVHAAERAVYKLVASAALFLASVESSFIAGINLVVDRGMIQV